MNVDKSKLQSYIEQFNIPKEEFEQSAKLQRYNSVLAEYYRRLADEIDKGRYAFTRATAITGESLLTIADRIEECSHFWNWNIHRSFSNMDLQSINFCKSRFCENCQKQIQDARIAKYKEHIDEMGKRPGVCIYLITITQPNVKGKELNGTIDALNEAFARLVQYFDGRKAVKVLNLTDWGFKAAIRGTEITFYNDKDSFHPHYHAIVAFDNYPDSPKTLVNKFSYSNGVLTNLFSPEEILLQKLWRLIYDRIVARRENELAALRKSSEAFKKVKSAIPTMSLSPVEISSTPELFTLEDVFPEKVQRRAQKIRLKDLNEMSNNAGYSLKIDRIEDNYTQVFKYAVKMKSDDKEFMSYRVFRTLFDVLYNRRMLQGYGEWLKITDVNEEEVFEKKEAAYKKFREILMTDTPSSETFSAMGSYQYSEDNELSRTGAKWFSLYYKSLSAEEREKLDHFLGVENQPEPENSEELSDERKARVGRWLKRVNERIKLNKSQARTERIYDEFIAPRNKRLEKERQDKEREDFLKQLEAAKKGTQLAFWDIF